MRKHSTKKEKRGGVDENQLKSGIEGLEDAVRLKFAHDEIQAAFDFLTDPHYSQHATIYHVSLCVVMFVYMLRLLGISMDGPNHYTGRQNLATDTWLPDEEGYWIILMVLSLPLIIDATGRAVLIGFMYYDEENQGLWKILNSDLFEKWLMIIEILSGLPLILNVGYFYPLRATMNFADLDESWRLLFRVLEMFNFARFIRATKDSLSMRALRMVIYNSAPHLMVSLSFFVGFICISAIVLFFMEPCYDEDICPWSDMFDSSWFSVVTMTTVGYGDMVPYYEHGRFFATIVMFFGTLFTSMPLAIIGNEYEQIIEQLKKEAALEALQRKRLKVGKAIHKLDADVIKRMQTGAKQLQQHVLKKAQLGDDNKNQAQMSGANVAARDKGGEGVAASEVKTILMSAVRSVRSTTAKLKIIIGYMKEKRKPGQKLGTVTDYRINTVTPEMLLTAAQLREWLMLLRVSLDRSVRMTEAACIDPDIMQEMEKKVAITEREAFELLSGEISATIATADEKKRKAKEAKRQTKRMKEKNRKRRTHATRGTLIRQSFLTADEKFEEMKRKIELKRRNKDLDTKRLTQTPSLVMEVCERTRHYNNILWAWILASGTNRVSPGADTSKAKHLSKDEYVDPEGQVHRHGHHHSPFLTRYFVARDEQIKEEPYTIQNRLYPLLMKPDSSKWAKVINNFMMICVLLSIALLFCQSLTSYQNFGEGTSYCEKAVEIYCREKLPATDPGCYVQKEDYSGMVVPHTRLQFQCKEANCYGIGPNFGSTTSLMSCKYRSDSSYWEDATFAASNTEQKNFRTRYELSREYGMTTMLTTRYDMQVRSDVCARIECRLDGEAEYNMDNLFLAAEITLNTVFTIEVLLRIHATGHTLVYFMSDISHILDVLAVLPFYLTLTLGGRLSNNLYLMPYIYGGIALQYLRSLKIARLFRVMQHFRSSRSLFETGYKAGPQMVTVLGCLLCIVIAFSLILFEIESGDACHISDKPGSGLNGKDMCGVDSSTGEPEIEGLYFGSRIVINQNGEYSQFRDAFQCMWFCFVTITTVGYGDYFPVTKNGGLLTIALMVLGGMYMAIPFTAIGAIFYETHLKNSAEEQKKIELAQQAEYMSLMIQKDEVEHLHEMTHIKSGQYVSKLFVDMYRRVDTMMHQLLKPREEVKLEFEPDEQRPGKLKPKWKKAPSKSMVTFIETGDEGYRLLSRTAGVLFDLTVFADAKEQYYQKNINKFAAGNIE